MATNTESQALELPNDLPVTPTDISMQDRLILALASGLSPKDAARQAGYSESVINSGMLYRKILASPSLIAKVEALGNITVRASKAGYQVLTPKLLEYDEEHLTDPDQPKVRERIAKISGLQAPDGGGAAQVNVQVTVLSQVMASQMREVECIEGEECQKP